MNQQSYQSMFVELEKIAQQIDKEESNSRSRFNIFTLLRKSSDEVAVHSRFLAELLNPNGNHGMSIFQRLFIEKVINAIIETNNEEYQWQREKIAPNNRFSCSFEKSHGKFGRIDILLENKEKIIVIENKIYAEDQKKQLERYYNACLEKGFRHENIYVIYLNLCGDEISNYGKGNLSKHDFAQISYKEDILPWLECCLETDEVKQFPHIEQTIIQYCTLIKKLTHTGTKSMTKQHIELLYQGDNFKLAQQLSQSFDKFKIDVQRKMWQDLQQSLKNKGYEFSYCDKDLQPINADKMCNEYYNARNAIRLYGIQSKLGNYKDYGVHCFIQINHNIYYGVTIAKDNKNGEPKRLEYGKDCFDFHKKVLDLPFDFYKKSINKGWFLGSHIFPTEKVNFMSLENSFYNLIDTEKRQAWIEKTTDEIISFIESVQGLNIIE